MSILEIKGLTQRYDDKYIFNNADLTVNNGEHIGIVGLNGAGKSTFINIISGNLSQDAGEVKWLNGIRKGYLDQHATIDQTKTVMEYLYSSFTYLDQINDSMNAIYEKLGSVEDPDEMDRLLNKAARMQEQLDNAGYYDLESKIKKVANGLGVNNIGYDRVIGTLSGGERAKVMLSQLLLEERDIILLDEPTNFLDIEHVDWLTKFLNSYPKTFLVISHDTKFLNDICKYVVNIENGNIKKYTGNYDQFLKQWEMNAKQYEENYNRQQAEIKRMQDYIDKNKARAATAGMANSRKKMLEKIEVMQKPVEIADAVFSFPYISLNSKDFLIVKGLKIGYDRQLLPPIDLHMSSQTKLWIRGTNGVGKSTLIKTLLYKIPSLGGTFNFHLSAKIGYLEQELRFDDTSLTPLTYYANFFPRASQKEQRSELAKVGIKGELASRQMVKMSGGEQVRTKLAVLCNTPSNVLILDEPTNHLDVRAKQALKDALIKYEGALILVSHEKEFADGICDSIFDAKEEY